jgi:hypothetical protein
MDGKLLVAGAAALALAGCGTTQGDRTLSGAMVGASAGLVAGPAGAAVGAVAGAGAGYVTEKDDIYLGKPVWKGQKAKSKPKAQSSRKPSS